MSCVESTRLSYKEGDTVRVNTGCLDVFGTVRGFSCLGIIDLWIIEVIPYDLKRLPDDHDYTCIVAPHVALTPIELKYPDVSEHDPHSVFAQANALATRELSTLTRVIEKKNKAQRKLRVKYLNNLRKELDGNKVHPI